MSDLIALHPNDDDTQRAINILMAGGFVINETVEKALPRMANAIRLYRDIDKEHTSRTADDGNLRAEQFTAPWPNR